MNFRRMSTKAVPGVAGIKCPCCRKGHHKQSKVWHNRILRHRLKIDLSKEAANENNPVD